jgi:hypothetical protein
MKVVSIKVEDETKAKMEEHPDINWSEVLRKSIHRRLAIEESLHEGVDRRRALRALKSSSALRKKSPEGWSGAEEIRKWRDLRR